MPYCTSTLLIRNLRDVFGENDPARRRAPIDEIFTESLTGVSRAMPADDLFDQFLAEPSGQWSRAQ